MNKRKLFNEGSLLWNEYVMANGYSWTYNNNGIKKLSKLLDLNEKYIRERIQIFLEA